MMKNIKAYLLIFISIMMISFCDTGGTGNDDLSDSKIINSFSFDAVNNSALSNDISGEIADKNITVTVPYATDITDLVATFTTTGEEVKIGNESQKSGINHNDYSTRVEYVIIAEDGSSCIYNVDVTIAPPSSKLKSLSANSGTLFPAFNPDIISYSISVENNITTITVTGEAFDPLANLSAQNGTPKALIEGDNIIEINVTAQDGIHSEQYEIKVNRRKKGDINIHWNELYHNCSSVNPEHETVPGTDFHFREINSDGSVNIYLLSLYDDLTSAAVIWKTVENKIVQMSRITDVNISFRNTSSTRYDIWGATIPAQPAGTTVYYYIRLTDVNNGNSDNDYLNKTATGSGTYLNPLAQVVMDEQNETGNWSYIAQ
ncbi:MAG TPA: cadherin-like beta sandwich domain-containing protein [Spirochaetota bacterium]|nr:cadherin-like beta sandwich domain-containing protein [Spirochaetota bacterium]HPJ43111.1 cadherin-like beta sandwich domain-containing protein [Spirochaetota bacterium]